ncbi:MAG: glycosyltransferase family 4 protein [Cyanobacteria bacterium J06649_5]
MEPLRLLLVSTPVAPLGSGLGGGVELTVTTLAQTLVARGHQVTIAAPAGSRLPTQASKAQHIKLVSCAGTYQPTAQSRERSAPIVMGSMLANAWEYARQVQADYDVLANFAYDWLPFYLTPFLTTPVAHFVSMGSLSDSLDEAITQVAARFPGTLGAYTQSQADTFSKTPSSSKADSSKVEAIGNRTEGQASPTKPHTERLSPIKWEILGSAIDIHQYDYRSKQEAGHDLAWVGRIAPEKGLEDAVEAALKSRLALNIFGNIEDPRYWDQIQLQIRQHPAHQSLIRYRGFLPTEPLQQALGQCKALLVTPKWIEAFGIVTIEALACGVPVIAYQRGGPAEIIRSGETGYLVEPDNTEALVTAIAKIDNISRYNCRQQVESTYSLEAWATRVERWLHNIANTDPIDSSNHKLQ